MAGEEKEGRERGREWEGREGRREGGLKEREKREEGGGRDRRDGNYLANEPSFSPDMSLSNSDFI